MNHFDGPTYIAENYTPSLLHLFCLLCQTASSSLSFLKFFNGNTHCVLDIVHDTQIKIRKTPESGPGKWNREHLKEDTVYIIRLCASVWRMFNGYVKCIIIIVQSSRTSTNNIKFCLASTGQEFKCTLVKL